METTHRWTMCVYWGDTDSAYIQLYLAITLALVVTLTGLFDFYQDRKSGNVMASFASMIPPKAEVSGVREGIQYAGRTRWKISGDTCGRVGGR